MIPTFEDIFKDPDNFGGTLVYLAFRAAKIREIAASLDGQLHSYISTEMVAKDILSNAEAMGGINGNAVSGVVPGHYTLDGKPLSVSI